MLTRKMLRELKENFGQFFSIFILSALAVALFITLKCNYLGASQAREPFHKATNLADGWLYGENFTKENLAAVRDLDFINDAQLRTMVTGSAPDQNSAEVDLILEDENIVNKPYILAGEEFDPLDTDSIWINERFADAWDMEPGDTMQITYNGITFSKQIRGLIASPEYEYMCASTDLEVDYKNIAYVYMSYRGFTADMLSKNLLTTLVKLINEELLLQMLPYTQMIITTDVEDVLSLEEELADALQNNYAAFVDWTSIPGIRNFSDELTQHKQFSYAFSLIFVLIALLVIMTTMNRMVDQQRTQIGTLNALGMKRWEITFHYISYSLFLSLAGSVVGLLIGIFLLGQWFVTFFQTYYTVPGWKPGYDITYFIVILLVVLACCGTSYLSCRRLLRVNPSESLRPAPPKSGKHCIFERLPFWNRLGFSSQYNLRDISRAKLRAFMGVFGTACGMILMVCGLGCNDTLDNILDWNFGKLQNYSYEMVLDESMNTSDADELAQKYNGELLMAAGVEIAAQPHAVSADKSTCTMVVTEGKGLFGITDTDQNVVTLEPGTIALTKKLAQKLNLSEGDKVYWHIYEKNDWYEAKIGIINRNPSLTGITMLREDYEKTGCEYHPSSLYTDEDVSGYTDSNISAIHNSSAIQDAYVESMQVMYIMLAFMISFSAVLIIVVLYNSGNLSFSERIREFATLKVMGFQSRKIRSLLSLQNLWLSFIGILAGAPFGRALMQYMFDSNGENYDYQAVIGPASYLLSGILVLGISVLVSFLFSKRIKRLDMVDVLKGME